MGILTVGWKMSQHTGNTISVEEADKFLAEVRKIMKEMELNFGPAVEVWSKRQQKNERLYGEYDNTGAAVIPKEKK